MRITCPTCSAAYEVPDALLGTGRPVRCVRCGADWVPRPGQAPAAPDEPALPPVGLPDHGPLLPLREPPPPAPPARAPGRGALLAAWAGSLALLALLATGFCVLRDPISRAWPPTARLYAALHLPLASR